MKKPFRDISYVLTVDPANAVNRPAHSISTQFKKILKTRNPNHSLSSLPAHFSCFLHLNVISLQSFPMNTNPRTLQTAHHARMTPTVRASVATAHAPCTPNRDWLVLFRGEGNIVRIGRCILHSHVVDVKGDKSAMINCNNRYIEYICISLHF
jgi:hypothetical protein